MGIFDLLTKAQAEATAKVKTLQKKIGETAEQLTAASLANSNSKAAPSKSKKTTKEKLDLSIEGISAQVIKQRDNIKKNGFKHYEFIANRGCCATCAALDGKHFAISRLKIGVNAPPMHDGCRCSIAAWVDD